MQVPYIFFGSIAFFIFSLYWILKGRKGISDEYRNILSGDISKYPRSEKAEVVIHHTATSADTTLLELSEIQSRRPSLGYPPGIVYHYVIPKNGVIVQVLPDNVVSPHTKGLNRQAIGIALIGNFEKDEPTKEQVKSLKRLIKQLDLPVSYHRDHRPTSCPGNNLIKALEQ